MTDIDNGGSFRVTTKDVYAAVQDLSRKVEAFAAQLEVHISASVLEKAIIENTQRDHEQRLRIQESRKIAPVAVWVAVIGLLVTIGGLIGTRI